MDANKPTMIYFYKLSIDAHYYGDEHPLNPFYINITHNHIIHYGSHRRLQINCLILGDKVDISRFHSEDYVELLSIISPHILVENSDSNIDDDCPIFDILFYFCCASIGSSASVVVCLNYYNVDITIN